MEDEELAVCVTDTEDDLEVEGLPVIVEVDDVEPVPKLDIVLVKEAKLLTVAAVVGVTLAVTEIEIVAVMVALNVSDTVLVMVALPEADADIVAVELELLVDVSDLRAESDTRAVRD